MSHREYNTVYSNVSKDNSPWIYETYDSCVAAADEKCSKEMFSKQPLARKNRKDSASHHVPHKYKPPQVVAKRNARERRRVHAVNTAFVKLRKAVPIQNARGKRVSKVKTLQHAIDYIRALQGILHEHEICGSSYVLNKYNPYHRDGYINNMVYENF